MKKAIYLLFCAVLCTTMAFAQKKTITGKVTDQSGKKGLSGVNVLADKQKGGTQTSADGTYTISVDKSATVLIFSYVGYDAQTVIIGDQLVMDVSMSIASKTEDEVIVVGYGTQRRGAVTGAVSKYQNEKLDETPSSRLDQALQGKIAGVRIQNVSSEAGADPKVQVRGLSSINAKASPLVVVDGHPVPDGLSFVNMADVQSVEVLKDAASAAIYGSRAANGVILISTKSGKTGKTKFHLKMSSGVKQANKLYDMMTTTEYTNMLFYEAALKNLDPSITPPTLSQIASTPERGAYIIESQLRGGQATNWQAEAIRESFTKNLQLSMSGGNSGVKFYLAGGYQNDQGMMYHSEYERYNLKAKIDATLSKKLKFTFNVNPSYIKRERPSTGYIDFVRFQSYLPVRLDEKLAAYVRLDPLYADVKAGDYAQARYFNGRVYNGLMPDGSIWVNSGTINPFNTSNNSPKSVLESRTIKTNDYRVLTSGDLSYKITPELELKVLGSAYVNYGNGVDFAQRNSNRAGDINRGVYNQKLYIDLLNENTLNYNKRFGDHSVSALAGFTVQKRYTKEERQTGLDYPSDVVTTLNNALIIEQGPTSTYNTIVRDGLVSSLGRINYGYKDKYLLTANFRVDNSSIFGPGQKTGYFPGISAGWVASKEAFLSNSKVISNLKLRASYGALGNNGIPPFLYTDPLYASNYVLGGQNGSTTAGFVPSRTIAPNPLITWERTFTTNLGLDLSMFRNRISISIDAYESNTEKLLLQQAVAAYTGVTSTFNNIGSLRNRGIELELTTVNVRNRNFNWSTSGNISHVANKITELGGEKLILSQGERTEGYLTQPGSPLVQFFGYKTDGVWLSQAQIDEAIAKGLKSNLSSVFVPGGLKLVDVNNDNVLDASDRVVTGNPYPDFIWGLNNNFKIKNLDFSFLLQGQQGGQIVNGDANYNETKRYNRNYNSNRWISPMFPGDGKTPYSTNGFNWMLTDYVVEDASYTALREILVGYTFTGKFIERTKLGGVRAYFSAQNVWLHTKSGYRGINVEARNSGGVYDTPLIDGYQRGAFPVAKTFLLGLDINF